MTLVATGGQADKYGNRFEGRWTTHCLAELLRGSVERIDLEPPGEAGEGVEFVLRRGERVEYHQVKGGRSAGQWTIQRLAREEVLGHFESKLKADRDCICVLVTEAPADALHGLIQAARSSSSVQDFESRLNEKLRIAWQQIKAAWPNLTPDEAVAALGRVHDIQWSEEALRTLLTVELEALLEGPANASVAVLAQYALDRLSGSVIAPDVWAHLGGLRMRPTDWAHDASVAQAVNDAVDRYLRPHREEAILGATIPRAEVDEVHRLLTIDIPGVVLVTGEGGIGKSAVAAQVVEALVSEGLPVLPLRADLLAPTMLPRGVGDQLGLPGSPPAVLGGISADRRSVLVLDQLDSVSLTSGRHPELWQCLREVIEEARYQRDMSVLIVCRRFDLENDDRLRTLRASDGGPATVVQVGPLSDETVGEVVASAGLSAQDLRPSQRELLAVPLHLRLLTLVASESGERTLNFETAKDLYDRFWEHKRQRVSDRMAPRTARWADVLVAASDAMSQRESLSIPRSSLDAFGDEVPFLLSEHVLVEEGGRVAFFHQGFFDYVFARAFRSHPEDLLSYLLETDQGLFRRAQVKQVLGYERDEEEEERYLRDLESMMNDSRIRFHLKRAALDHLMTVSDPSHEEWAIVERGLESGGEIKQHILDLLSGSPAWFDLVVDRGAIAAWLSSKDDERISEAVTILGRIQRSRPTKVAELLTPFIGTSEEWNRRLLWLIQWADLAIDRSFLDFFLQLLESGALDDARGPIAVNSDFWSLIYGLSKKHPDWACEVTGGYLNRRLQIANDAGEQNPFDGTAGSIPETQHTDMIVEAAEGAPKAFVRHVMPFMLEVVDRTVDKSKLPPRHDPVWGFRYPDEAYTLRSALLRAMEIALKGLASEETDTFQGFVEESDRRESETLDFLVLRGFLGAPPELADAAIDYILAVPDRLHIGYASEGSWASRELLSWAVPACSPDRRGRAFSAILAYFPAWERSASGRRAHGQCQYVLLAGIPSELLPPESKRRLQELERKFGASIEPPASPEAFMVGSPIAEPSTERMTDEQWVRAMSKYSADWSDLSRSAEGGGAVELSRTLAQRAREDPARFVALIEHAPDDLNPEYFSAVVGAVGDPASGADMALLVRACQRADSLGGKPCGMAIARASEQRAGEIPQALVEMLGRYALEDPDPATETWEQRSTSGQQFYLGDVYTAGINCTRGAAAEAIAANLFSGGEHVPALRTVLERLVEDPFISVRACVAKCLLALLNHDRSLAIDLFLRLTDAREELLGTPYIERFIHYAALTDFALVEPVIERMVASDIDEVGRAGARQACLASLELDEAAGLRNRCMGGGATLRSGAAEVFAANLRSAGHRQVCEQSLLDLFNDPEPDVSKQAAGCFQHLKGAELADFAGLAMAFVESPAFVEDHLWLLQALEACEVALPDVTCRFAERFVEVAGAASGDIRTSNAAHSGDVSQLLMRAYSQYRDPGMRSRVLDVIDRMSALRSYGLEAALAAFERS